MHQPCVDFLPSPVRAALENMKDEFNPQSLTWSLSSDKKTVKLEIEWEKLTPTETRRWRGDRGRQTTTNSRGQERAGDYTKVKEHTRKHGRTRRVPNLGYPTTYTKYHSDLFTKSENIDLPNVLHSMKQQEPSLSATATLPVKVERDTSTPKENLDHDTADYRQVVDGKTKKKRNRRSRRQSDTVASPTIEKTNEVKLEDLADLLNEIILPADDQMTPLLKLKGKETKKEETPGKETGPKSDSLCSLL